MAGVPNWEMRYHTLLFLNPDETQATSPILDRLAARYFVAPARANPFGRVERAVPPDGDVTLAPGQQVRAPLASPGPLRGVAFTVHGRVPADAVVNLVLLDPYGGVLGQGVWRAPPGFVDGPLDQPVVIAVAGEDIPASAPVTVEFTVTGTGPVTLRATAGSPVMAVFRPAADNLRLVFAGSAVVYQRLGALPRIRWASQQLVLSDPTQQVSALAAGQVQRDTVVVDRAAGPADGQPATIQVVADDPDAIGVDVRAEGAGYLVVADSLLVGWSATVDGRAARIVAADHAVSAVAVSAGPHRVELRYTPPTGNLGGRISLLALVVLLALGVVAGANGAAGTYRPVPGQARLRRTAAFGTRPPGLGGTTSRPAGPGSGSPRSPAARTDPPGRALTGRWGSRHGCLTRRP